MQIHVIAAHGTGSTPLSAFDTALKNAGVLNYNIIPLSSVIPPHTTVVKKKKFIVPTGQVGFRLYAVMAETRTSLLGTTIGAGLGWYIFDKGGVFVEHYTEGNSEETVREELAALIFSSLSDLCKNRKKQFQKNKVQYHMSICPPKPTPRSALTIALYKAEPW